MCGFLAQFDLSRRSNYRFSEFVPLAEKLISRRGPDSLTLYNRIGCQVLFARLCITDPEHGIQPFVTKNGTLGFGNGEIYNSSKLVLSPTVDFDFANALGNADIRIAGEYLSNDLESNWEKLDGMFALVFQSEDGKVVVGRDRTGQKPVFYYRKDSLLIVSSNFEALALQINKSLTIDSEQLSTWIKFGGVQPGNTLLSEIKEVKPGSVQIFHTTETRYVQYWSWPSREMLERDTGSVLSIGSAAIELVRSDGPPDCVLWSGGVDSTAIVRHFENISKPIKAVHISFRTHSFNEPLESEGDEGVCVTNVVFEDWLNRHNILRTISAMDQPISDPACLPLYLACETVKQLDCRVIYTGDGADELLLGYEALRREVLLKFLVFGFYLIPKFLRRQMLLTLGNTKDTRYISRRAILGRILAASLVDRNDLERTIISPNHFMLAFKGFFWETKAEKESLEGYFHNFVLPQIYLQKTDRISAGMGLEARAPWLVNEFILCAMQYTKRNLLKTGKPIKAFLTTADKKIIKKKHGLGVPLYLILEKLDEPDWSIPGLTREQLSFIWQKAKQGGSAPQQLAWSLFVLQTKLTHWRELEIIV